MGEGRGGLRTAGRKSADAEIAAPLPANERERLAALARYRILDTPAEQAYDDFTQLAAQICDVPIALISLIDKDRQWFKSWLGLDSPETPREQAFFAHAIIDNQMLIVPDARADARFAANPLVTGSPNIRFYAGSPLVTDEGYGLGVLCVIDRQPRDLTAAQQASLQALSRQLMTQLELRRAMGLLIEAERAKKILWHHGVAGGNARASKGAGWPVGWKRCAFWPSANRRATASSLR